MIAFLAAKIVQMKFVIQVNECVEKISCGPVQEKSNNAFTNPLSVMVMNNVMMGQMRTQPYVPVVPENLDFQREKVTLQLFFANTDLQTGPFVPFHVMEMMTYA
jgi:hypothetical protein